MVTSRQPCSAYILFHAFYLLVFFSTVWSIVDGARTVIQLPPEPCAIGCQCSRPEVQPESITSGNGRSHHLHRWNQLMSAYRQQHSVLRDNEDQQWHHHDDNPSDLDDAPGVTTGRVMTCNGLLELPEYLPPDISKLVIYGQRPLGYIQQRDSPADADKPLDLQASSSNGYPSDTSSILHAGTQNHHQLTHLDRKFRAAIGRSTIDELTIENNRIKVLTEADLEGLYGLRWLRMPNNRIKMIRSHALDAVHRLERLDLSRNHLRSFGKTTFDAARQLRVLDLSSNHIQSLPPTAFRNLFRLERLDLSGNKLNGFDAKLFGSTTELRKLTVNRNKLTTIPYGSMSALTRLEELSLVGNRLRSTPADAFAGYDQPRHDGTNFQDLSADSADSSDSRDDDSIDSIDASDEREDRSRKLRLQRLFLDKNQIVSLTRGDVAIFPRLVVLSLTHNNLTAIEDYAFVDLPHLERLSLDHNAIETLSDQSFRGLDALRELGLSHNDLGSLPTATFGSGYGLSKLERLDLSHNRIDSIPSRAFDGLGDLRELRLDHNSIRWIDVDGLAIQNGQTPPFVAASDTKLTWLYLGHNQLDRLTQSMSSGLHHLKFLDIAGNQINHLDVEAFQTTPRLANLLMQDNRITVLESGLFRGLNALRHLNLAGNKISTVGEETFLGLDRIEDITLDDNEIAALPAAAFNYTPRLTLLSVRKNLIRVADLTLVNFARRLRHLDLAQNLVSFVVLPDPVTSTSTSTSTSSSTMYRNTTTASANSTRSLIRHAGFEALSFVDNLLESIDEKISSMMRVPLGRGPHRGTGGGTLRLHGNPWACDCRLSWLVDAVSRARVRGAAGIKMTSSMAVDRQSVDDMLCKSPSYLAGRKLQSLNAEELQCH